MRVLIRILDGSNNQIIKIVKSWNCIICE
jgi:hypothetical protein